MIRALLILTAFFAVCIPVYADTEDGYLTQILDADLNGNGFIDSIVLEFSIIYGDFSLYINDSRTDGWIEEPSGFETIDLDGEDGMIEILIHSQGPSDDPNCLIFAYDGESIIPVGNLWGTRAINGDGSVYVRAWRGFWSSTDKYVLMPVTHQLEKIPQMLYYVDIWYSNQFETPGIVVMESFPIYRNPDSEEIVEQLEINSTITIIACKPTMYVTDESSFTVFNWYLILSETSILGWANESEFLNKVEGITIAG